MDSGALECSVPALFVFEIERVDASRRVTSSVETEAAFSLADTFFVGTTRVRLDFALVAMSKRQESSKTNKRLTRVKDRSRDRTLIDTTMGIQSDTVQL
jgi:hypothetical protein